MSPKTRILCDRLREATKLLRRVGENHWSEWLDDSLCRIENSDFSGIKHLRDAFGGMGSFDDLIIMSANGHVVSNDDCCAVNARLDDLRHELYELSDYIRHNAEVLDR
jgi:hypothetical protein